ncbi:MAG: septum formation initiator family protein [Lachnospiraceae bacterium]|nr:septum formation initiator family protein [Lachnospiraceae bacterium]
MRESSTRKRKRSRRRRREYFVVGLIAFLFTAILMVLTMSLSKDVSAGEDRVQRIQAQIDEEKARAEELEKEKTYMKSREFIEKIARERLGLVSPGETIIKPKE